MASLGLVHFHPHNLSKYTQAFCVICQVGGIMLDWFFALYLTYYFFTSIAQQRLEVHICATFIISTPIYINICICQEAPGFVNNKIVRLFVRQYVCWCGAVCEIVWYRVLLYRMVHASYYYFLRVYAHECSSIFPLLNCQTIGIVLLTKLGRYVTTYHLNCLEGWKSIWKY